MFPAMPGNQLKPISFFSYNNRRNQTVSPDAFSQVRHFVIIENIERVIRKTVNLINTDFSDIGFQGGSLSVFFVFRS